ncbi:MAG: DNA-3-methyladenine glycosylase I [Gammaproteobacteria bacterium]|nr:DNA-3-methyladenine glycosylase I [Gammaproteobacteria bacterium]
MKKITRCEWANGSELDAHYHDREWGVPSTDDQHLFEMLILEGAQAGLSWSTILKKRDNYRRAYYDFDPARVARFTSKSVERLLGDAGIVRNRLKVEASIQNARAFLKVQEEFGSFSYFIWEFVGGKPIINRRKAMSDIPAETEESQALSKALKQRGFKFVGPTICYAFMQAVGMVNDHEVGCFRYKEVNR